MAYLPPPPPASSSSLTFVSSCPHLLSLHGLHPTHGLKRNAETNRKDGVRIRTCTPRGGSANVSHECIQREPRLHRFLWFCIIHAPVCLTSSRGVVTRPRDTWDVEQRSESGFFCEWEELALKCSRSLTRRGEMNASPPDDSALSFCRLFDAPCCHGANRRRVTRRRRRGRGVGVTLSYIGDIKKVTPC